MTEEIDLTQPIVDALEDLKALDIRIIDVRGQTSVTDWLVIASGTSSRHVKSLANHVAQEMKVKHGVGALGSEGADAAEWVWLISIRLFFMSCSHPFVNSMILKDSGIVAAETRLRTASINGRDTVDNDWTKDANLGF